jgi:hypothetical protein
MNRLAAFNATADAVEGGVRQLMTQVCIGAASVTFHRDCLQIAPGRKRRQLARSCANHPASREVRDLVR